MTELVMMHQAQRLLNRLQKHVSSLPQHSPERIRAYRVTRRAFKRCCRRYDSWEASRK